MLFNSISYLLFFPILFVIYFLLPHRFRYLWLLVASYFFYMCWNATYALLMATSTLITYLSGLCIDHYRQRGNQRVMKLCVAASFLLNIGILFFFKYANFMVSNVNQLLTLLGQQDRIKYFDVLLPVGISFYTFQALGYTMDVYRQTIKPERNFFMYALFVSFFPQLVAGPIERTGNLLPQFREHKKFSPYAARQGLLLIAWGLFLKMVLADNLARVVNPIYEQYTAYAGIEIILATVLFAFQIYCDFAAYSYIASGSAQILGFSLMENFRCPYHSASISDFWHRWHLSLTTWFTDYLYIPLGGNRKGQVRKYINTMIVFLVSGFWHGANWTFVLWGALNGVMIVLGDATKALRRKFMQLLHINADCTSHLFFRRALTFSFICFTWVFFRAKDMQTAFSMLKSIVTNLSLHKLFALSLFDVFGNTQLVFVIICAMLALLCVDHMRNRNILLTDWITAQGAFLRWSVYMGLLFAIIIFGVYGKTFVQTQFIYFQF